MRMSEDWFRPPVTKEGIDRSMERNGYIAGTSLLHFFRLHPHFAQIYEWALRSAPPPPTKEDTHTSTQNATMWRKRKLGREIKGGWHNSEKFDFSSRGEE